MLIFKVLLLSCLVYTIKCDCGARVCEMQENFSKDVHNKKVAESQLASQIIALLDHYKQPDPVGIPGALVPDPFPVPNIEHSLGMGVSLTLHNALAYGFAKFRMKSVSIDINQMLVKAEIQLDDVKVIGNYTLSSLFSTSHGPFNLTMTNIVASGNASVAVERDGKIRTQNILMDMSFSNLTTHFQNLGMVANFFQSLINNSPNMVFDTIKPFMLQEAYSKLRNEIDTNIMEMMGDSLLPNSISPLDMMIGEARRSVREKGYDPLILRTYNHSVGLFNIQLKNTWINGLSSFHRIGDVILSLQNNTVSMGINVGTQQITGSSNWEISAGKGIITRTGHIQFFVEFIRGQGILSQTLDTRNRPQVQELELEIGNIQIRSDGAGTFDYVVELLINVLPNILRYQIMDALEYPARAKIQDELNKINVEATIKNNIPSFERMSKSSPSTFNDFKF